MDLKQYNSDLWYFLLAMKDRYLHTHWDEMFGFQTPLYSINKEQIKLWMDKCLEIAKKDIDNL